MSFDSETRELLRDGQALSLNTQEAALLEALLQRNGRVLSKTEIAALLWPDSQYGEFDLAINNIVSKLRKALGEDGRETRCIKTVPKAGYRIACQVASEEPAAALVPDEASAPAEATALQPSFVYPPATVALRPKHRLRPFLSGLIASLLLLSMATGGFLVYRHRQQASGPSAKVLGILPFTIIGAEESPLTGETLRGEIADSIAEIPGVQVRAAHSLTLDMGKNDSSLRDAAQRLSLDLVLTGTLRLTTDSFECDLELIRGSDSSHLRSFHYEGPRMGLSTVPDQIESSLFTALSSKSDKQQAHYAGLGSTQETRAYDLAFQATEALMERSASSVARASGLYRQAIEQDAQYAKAYSGLAESEVVAADLGAGLEEREHFEAARSAALQALTLNPDNAQAHSVLGLVYLQRDWQFDKAEQELRTALRLNPGLATNHTRLAILLTDRGNFKEAEHEVDLAHTLDPYWPVVYGMGVYVHVMERKYPQAIADGKAIVAMRPDWERAHSQLGWAYWYAGQHSDAIHEWIKAATLAHDTKLAAWETQGLGILEKQGVQAYSLAKYHDFSAEGAHGDFVPAEWAAFAGNATLTLDALTQMLNRHDPEFLKIAYNPAYDFLRDTPGFRQLQKISSRAFLPANSDRRYISPTKPRVCFLEKISSSI